MEDRIEAPDHLKPATREWWQSVLRDWALEPHHVRLLTLAGESWDRAQEAREVIDADGLTVTDRFDQLRPHPLLAVERDNRIAFARFVRELRLDDSEPEDPRLPRPGDGPVAYGGQ